MGGGAEWWSSFSRRLCSIYHSSSLNPTHQPFLNSDRSFQISLCYFVSTNYRSIKIMSVFSIFLEDHEESWLCYLEPDKELSLFILFYILKIYNFLFLEFFLLNPTIIIIHIQLHCVR